MELGEKLRKARLEAGLSQRQLCGQEITRNMLSQIEHGTCNPSVSTLCFLARQLGLPVSYFLEEDTAASANGGCMGQAWASFEAGDASGALQALEGYRGPDGIFDRDYYLLKSLCLLHLAQTGMESGRQVYAKKLLTQAQALEENLPWLPELKWRRQALLSRLGEQVPDAELDCLDEALLLHAASALESGNPCRAAAYLDACQVQSGQHWLLLRGKAYFALAEYEAAVTCFREVEKNDPAAAIPMLEQCFSALGDYRSAYEYACKGRRESS